MSLTIKLRNINRTDQTILSCTIDNKPHIEGSFPSLLNKEINLLRIQQVKVKPHKETELHNIRYYM